MSSVPDHHSKANITSHIIIFDFPVLIKVGYTLYHKSVKYAIAYVFKNVLTLIRKHFINKKKNANHHLNLQGIAVVTQKITDQRSP